MFPICDKQDQRVVEDCRSLLEGDSMLAPIARSLRRIPRTWRLTHANEYYTFTYQSIVDIAFRALANIVDLSGPGSAWKKRHASTEHRRSAECTFRTWTVGLRATTRRISNGAHTLAHHIDIAFLKEAYERTRKDGAVGLTPAPCLGGTHRVYRLGDHHEEGLGAQSHGPFARCVRFVAAVADVHATLATEPLARRYSSGNRTRWAASSSFRFSYTSPLLPLDPSLLGAHRTPSTPSPSVPIRLVITLA